MTAWIKRFFACGLLPLVFFPSAAQEACCELKVPASMAARWVPTPRVMEDMRKACGPRLGATGSRCLLEWMTCDNASYEAMVFTRSVGVRGFLVNYRQEGMIGIATVVFPEGTSDRLGILLVNGDPFRFDPDDPDLPLPEGVLQNPRYQSLAAQHGPLKLVPGDRLDDRQILAMADPGGGQRFLFGYSLTSSRDAAAIPVELLAWVRFDSTGKFIGRELESFAVAE